MKKLVIILSLALLIILALGVSGCKKKATTSSEQAAAEQVPDKLPPSHSLKKTEEQKMIKDARKGLRAIAGSSDDTAALETGLMGEALENMNKQIADERAAGTIKYRRYDDMKLSLENYTKGIGGLALTFTDNSYVVDAASERVITKASGKTVKLILALKKIDKRWMIFSILSTDTKPIGQKTS